jgi:hypothetical protein
MVETHQSGTLHNPINDYSWNNPTASWAKKKKRKIVEDSAL